MEIWTVGFLCFMSFGIVRTDCKCNTKTRCPEIKSDFLNVHVVSHSHDDVGWLKTVEQYYYGANNSIQVAGVQWVYDSVLDELWNDPEKRFVSVEMEFFSHWWREQDSVIRGKIRKVIERGQLEFVGGGWCMNDEAAASYVDIVDQMTMGLKFINDTFGPCAAPKAVWQIDPFGHSREQASIFARMGFEYLFLGRIDHQDKDSRLAKKEMEMIWNVSDSLKELNLFTGILYNTYSPPPGFCFDLLCRDEPIVDDASSPLFNVDRKSKLLVAYILEQAKHYSTNNVILTMGEDFNYQYAHLWFKNLDKLIKYINKAYAESRIRLFYSTPSCYGRAVRQSLARPLPTKADDFFPYSSDPHAYWTGYFTSRPSFKGMVRQTSNLLQACKQLTATSGLSDALFQFQRSQAIAQHHDTVTGTAKQHVSDDYSLRLDQGFKGCHHLISKSYAELLSNRGLPLTQEFCPLLNVSQCPSTEQNSSFIVTVYNPLPVRTSPTIRLPVGEGSFTVSDHQAGQVRCQLLPIPDAVFSLPGRSGSATHELFFTAVELPPLGLRSYYVHQENRKRRPRVRATQLPAPHDFIASAYGTTLRFDRHTGLLVKVGDRNVQQQLLQYAGMAGNNTKFEYRASGAYIFRNNGTASSVGNVTRLTLLYGPLVTEVRQHFTPWATQIVRLYSSEPEVIELDWVVGPIPVEDGVGKEIVVRFTDNGIKSNGVFYTDANGREMLERRVDYQPTYAVNITEPVAGNYYPVNAMAYVTDRISGAKMTVLNDRAQGASSLQPGSLEFMVHRRLLHDDAFGVGEALNETAYGSGLVVRGSHWLVLSDKAVRRPLAQRKAHPPVLTFVPTKLTADEWRQSFLMEASLISRELPPNVHLLTLEPWDGSGRLLVRLEHIYASGEDELFSQTTVISLKNLFVAFDIESVEEVNLAANSVLGALNPNDWEVTLRPMEIRTLIITPKA